MLAMLAKLKRFFAEAPGALAGFVNLDELARSIVTAIGSGGAVGIGLAVVGSLAQNVAAIFPNPLLAAVASIVLALVADLLRRMQHGAPSPSA